jgi:dihydrofolate synthase/folylpolyglutamate synthase
MTGLRGRWETLATTPLTICDTGHNSHGIKYVVEQLRSLLQSPKDKGQVPTLHIVFGMVSDKDVDVVREMLHRLQTDFPGRVIIYPCQAKTKRAIAAPMSVEEAVRAAQKAATDRDIIFIGGSNYVVGEALPLFN